MRLTYTISLVLAALFICAATGSPASPAKSHKSVAPAFASHNKARHPATHAAAHAKAHANKRGAAPRVSRSAGHRTATPSPRSHTARKASRQVSPGKPSRSHSDTNSDPAAEPAQHAEPTQAAEPTEAAEPPQVAQVQTPERPAVFETVSLHKSRSTMPPPLRGSMESLIRQNEKTEADNLERIQDDDDLNDRIARGMLVPVPVSIALTINGNLPANRRYCRPWTAAFLSDLARAHAAEFHAPLQVSSAVRTVAYQKQLMRVNGNATSAEGDIASPHLTGATIDIPKQGLSRQEIAWMRLRLLPLQNAGKIDVEEEFQQSCFHITVYKSYVPPKPVRKPTLQATGAQTKTAQAKTQPGFIGPMQPVEKKPQPDQLTSVEPRPAQPGPEPLKPAQPKTPRPRQRQRPSAAPPQAPAQGE